MRASMVQGVLDYVEHHAPCTPGQIAYEEIVADRGCSMAHGRKLCAIALTTLEAQGLVVCERDLGGFRRLVKRADR